MNKLLAQKTGPWLFQGECMNDLYESILSTIRLDGEQTSPRGLPTTELLHVVTRIDNPRKRVLTIPGRKLNPFFNLAESLWMLSGRSDAKWILQFNSKLQQYLDPPLTHFHGAYGERIRNWGVVTRLGMVNRRDRNEVRDQLYDALVRLEADPDSRQAVMVLWNPTTDHPGMVSRDYPCNIAVAFKLRADRLFMSVFNRSNDVVLGMTSTNIVQFSTLQEVLACWLGAEPGPYTHYSDSLHLYDSQAVRIAGQFNVYDFVDPTPMARLSYPDFTGMLDAYWKKSLVAFLQECPCPYWSSVAYALSAYQAEVPVAALGCVTHMAALDWRIECLRFLVRRWRGKQDVLGRVRQHLIDPTALPLRGDSLEKRQALTAYVFQDSEPDSHDD